MEYTHISIIEKILKKKNTSTNNSPSALLSQNPKTDTISRYIYIYIYKHIYTHIYIHTYICTYTSMHVHTHMYINTHIFHSM